MSDDELRQRTIEADARLAGRQRWLADYIAARRPVRRSKTWREDQLSREIAQVRAMWDTPEASPKQRRDLLAYKAVLIAELASERAEMAARLAPFEQAALTGEHYDCTYCDGRHGVGECPVPF